MKHLFLWTEGDVRSLTLQNEPSPEKSRKAAYPIRYRVSPLFPVLPVKAANLNLSGDQFVGFYFYERPFTAVPVICRLLKPLPRDCQRSLWMSHGLASIVIFSNKLDTLKAISVEHNDGLRAFEWWDLNDGVVSQMNSIFYGSPQLEKAPYAVRDYVKLSRDLRAILAESEHCVNTAVARALLLVPGMLKTLAKVVGMINEIVGELLYLEHPKTVEAPQSLLKGIKRTIAKKVERQALVNQRTGILVSINSCLSSMTTQIFSGMPPLSENECPIRSYSLLGIGTAFLGVSDFCRHMEYKLEKFPVAKVISEFYGELPAVDIFVNITKFDPTVWDSYKPDLDTLLKNTLPEPSAPKLIEISGPHGFRESEVAVTIPMPVLSACDTAAWSLMTLSHELLHGHVRGLLSAIFKDKDGRSMTESFPDFHERFKRMCKKASLEEFKLQDCLRFIIFNYCVRKEALSAEAPASENEVSESGEPSDVISIRPTTVPDAYHLRRLLEVEWSVIHDIIVHLLDYVYFYNRSDQAFIRLLWSSWARVPIVLKNMETYLLRTIVTVASKEDGKYDERFEIACKIVTENLRLLAKSGENIVVSEALKLLKKKTLMKRMGIVFMPALYLSEMANKFLVSGLIHSSLFDDPSVDVDKDAQTLKYLLNGGEFPGIRVESPVALVFDRLGRQLHDEKSKLSQEHRSIWLLLACSSAYYGGGGDYDPGSA